MPWWRGRGALKAHGIQLPEMAIAAKLIGEVEIERDEHSILSPAGVENLGIGIAPKTFVKNRLYLVPGVAEQRLSVPRKVLVQLEPDNHLPRLGRNGNDPLPGQIGSVTKCGRDVLGLQGRILVENAFGCLAGRKIVENNRYWDPRASEAHGTMHDLRIGSDVRFPVHRGHLHGYCSIYHRAPRRA